MIGIQRPARASALGRWCAAFGAGILAVGAGCGNRERDLDPADRGSTVTVVATIGDSVTAGAPLWDPNPAVRNGLGARADERNQFQYWVERRRPDLNLRNCGVSGARTDQIAALLAGCAEEADALVIQGGGNDILQGVPAGVIIENFRKLISEGRRRGLGVAIADIVPARLDGRGDFPSKIEALNRRIRRLGRSEGVEVLAFSGAVEDPARPGTFAAGLTDDGIHPSVAGHRRIAERAFRLPRMP